jgi:sarcosine oxidase/L-pipecolate oxidase
MSWANVLSLATKNPDLAARIQELPNSDAIRDALGTGGSSGSWGYINRNSGWANAAASMAWFLDRVKQTRRVNFVAGTVVSLEHNETTVTGAKLNDGRVLSADLVVVAAGAWTGGLVDLAGQTVATAQVLGYLDLTEDEQAKLAHMPVILNLSTGLFIIPPTDRVLKVARHAYGYINPTTLPSPPLPLTPSTTTTPSSSPAPRSRAVSLPRTTLNHPHLTIPASAKSDLRRALRQMIPLPSLHNRPFSKTRLCWYSDTRTGDFLIDYHPHWQNLFVATGDSGHAFKFLPVIGDKIAACIARDRPGEFEGKWEWKVTTMDDGNGGDGEEVVTEDGTRSGKRGVVLDDALAEVVDGEE